GGYGGQGLLLSADRPARARNAERRRTAGAHDGTARGRRAAPRRLTSTYKRIRPRRAAIVTASVRLEAPSLPHSDATWNFAVFSLMPSRRAMPLFGSPCATSCSTCSSRAVSGSDSGAGATREAALA